MGAAEINHRRYSENMLMLSFSKNVAPKHQFNVSGVFRRKLYAFIFLRFDKTIFFCMLIAQPLLPSSIIKFRVVCTPPCFSTAAYCALPLSCVKRKHLFPFKHFQK